MGMLHTSARILRIKVHLANVDVFESQNVPSLDGGVCQSHHHSSSSSSGRQRYRMVSGTPCWNFLHVVSALLIIRFGEYRDRNRE